MLYVYLIVLTNWWDVEDNEQLRYCHNVSILSDVHFGTLPLSQFERPAQGTCLGLNKEIREFVPPSGIQLNLTKHNQKSKEYLKKTQCHRRRRRLNWFDKALKFSRNICHGQDAIAIGKGVATFKLSSHWFILYGLLVKLICSFLA